MFHGMVDVLQGHRSTAMTKTKRARRLQRRFMSDPINSLTSLRPIVDRTILTCDAVIGALSLDGSTLDSAIVEALYRASHGIYAATSAVETGNFQGNIDSLASTIEQENARIRNTIVKMRDVDGFKLVLSSMVSQARDLEAELYAGVDVYTPIDDAMPLEFYAWDFLASQSIWSVA